MVAAIQFHQAVTGEPVRRHKVVFAIQLRDSFSLGFALVNSVGRAFLMFLVDVLPMEIQHGAQNNILCRQSIDI